MCELENFSRKTQTRAACLQRKTAFERAGHF